METNEAVQRLSALAQEGRLSVFRMLVRAGEGGLPAGELARAAGVPANTLSAQLNLLVAANLVTRRRDGRSIVYTADYAGMSELILHLMEDCCQGRAEVCRPVAEAAGRCRPQPAQGNA